MRVLGRRYPILGYATTVAYVVPVSKGKSSRERQRLLDLLRRIRTDAGLTQAAMAKKLGQPQSYVSKYESGERRLDILELGQVCHAAGISLSDFVQQLEKEAP